jgi:hypothetical protein
MSTWWEDYEYQFLLLVSFLPSSLLIIFFLGKELIQPGFGTVSHASEMLSHCGLVSSGNISGGESVAWHGVTQSTMNYPGSGDCWMRLFC